jgi:hypothetical protein
MKIGFDLDGVLTDANIPLYRFIYYSLKEKDPDLYDVLRSTYYNALKPLHSPELFLAEGDEYYIITGRHSPTDDTVTREWCGKHCPNNKGVHIVGRDGKSTDFTMAAKAEKIRELGIRVYFDDDPRIVNYLRNSLPDVTIIQIGGVKTIKTMTDR